VQLISYLSLQCALPKAFNVARHVVSTMNIMASGNIAMKPINYLVDFELQLVQINSLYCFIIFEGLMSEERAEFFVPALSALERLCIAFPPIVDDIISLLMHLGKICTAQNAIERNRMCKIVRNKRLLRQINTTYKAVISHVMMDGKIM
jgi:integrator complex subunit 2